MASSGADKAKVMNVAVIGSGITGLSAAWLLSRQHRVTLYERAPRLGGHSNTVTVPSPQGPVAVDTGFIVYNEKTYPNLTALFAHLKVPTKPSDMSFAVSLRGGATEYSGTGLKGLFAQKRNFLSPRFWRMLKDLRRFYREAPDHIADLDDPAITLGDYLDHQGYGEAVRDDHLAPMAAAIWSSPAKDILDYPAQSFIRFCTNHGLLQVRDRPVWRTVDGGSRVYVDRFARLLGDSVRLGAGVVEVVRPPAGGVVVKDVTGRLQTYDQVVIASHADQALAMLSDRTADEVRLLGAFRYTANRAVLHTDAALMPRRRSVWSSWNYLETGADLGLTYWMNRLQRLPGQNLFVTLNPPTPPRAGTVLHEETYEHPVFNTAAIRAQAGLWSLQGERNTWFCGAYFGAGFHEDGLQSGLAVAEQLGGVRRPWSVADESGRIQLHSAKVMREGVAA